MSTNDLVKILTEVITSSPLNIPPYKHTEISEAEEFLRNGRWHLQNILNSQKTSVARVNAELELVNDRLRDAGEAEVAQLRARRNTLEIELRRVCAPPTVALTIMISKLQQLRRGVTIYKVLRLRKLLSICFQHLLSQASKQTDPIDHSDLFNLPPNLIEKCSEEERATLGHVLHCLKSNKVQEMFDQFPTEPSLDHGRGWLDPALWLVALAARSNPASNKENLPMPLPIAELSTGLEIEPWTYSDFFEAKEDAEAARIPDDN